jgi:hypothetical protein
MLLFAKGAQFYGCLALAAGMGRTLGDATTRRGREPGIAFRFSSFYFAENTLRSILDFCRESTVIDRLVSSSK